MKFFVPNVTDERQAERVIEAIAKFLQRPVPPLSERLWSLKYKHNGNIFEVEVGQPLPDYYREAEPTVIAIFGGHPLLVCTLDRGVRRGEPVYVGRHSVIHGEYFEDDQ